MLRNRQTVFRNCSVFVNAVFRNCIFFGRALFRTVIVAFSVRLCFVIVAIVVFLRSIHLHFSVLISKSIYPNYI